MLTTFNFDGKLTSYSMYLLRRILLRSVGKRNVTVSSARGKSSCETENKSNKTETQTQTPSAVGSEKKPRFKTFKIYRYDPSRKNKKPYLQSYTINLNDCRPAVLDALNKIKTEQDSTLGFRRSCREGICGSCGVNIDGINKLSCLDKINPRGVTKIYPLPHMYVIKDLIVDYKQFLRQHARTKPYLIRKDISERDEGKLQCLQSIKDRDNLIGKVECILCACCSTACPEYWWHGHTKEPNDFLGPAALLSVYRWIVDSRDTGTEERLSELRNFYHVYRCHQINNCTSVCPKHLEPGVAIANLRLLLARLKRKKKPDLEGKKESDPYKACEKKSNKDKCVV